MQLELGQLDHRYARLRASDARQEARLLSSLAERGQQTPIVVVAGESSAQFVLIDGHKRVRALAKLREDLVEATAWPEPEPVALVLAWALRSTSYACSALEEAWLLCELHDRHAMSLSELATRFDKSKSWVSRRVALVSELPDEVQEQVRRGEVAAHAAGKFLVPLARANGEACVTLSRHLAGHQASTREVGALYAAWQGGTEAEREALLEDPWLFLRAAAAAAEAPAAAVEGAGAALVRDLGAVAAIARRIHRRLREGVAQTLSAAERDDARRGAAQALASFAQMKTRAEKELIDARRDDAVGDPAAA